ncbi:MAG: polyprenyl synthetase family protein [Deltaproteobacteria bacterium]|nr:polyprenyl synthetase family protein [Deltaproteobacteria bacterium]
MSSFTHINQVFTLIEDDLKETEAAFSHYLGSDIALIPKIGEHIILSGGKRLRPALLILTCSLFGGKRQTATLMAAVIEFVHTATLLHDDVVDEADMRRGLAAANTIWGNEASVLVGDFLFAMAFDLAVDQGSLASLKALSSATRRLAEGEILELMKTADVSTTESDYTKIIDGKTAVLMAAACEIGAIIAQVDPDTIEQMKEFGSCLGIAFQMIDDILDYTSCEEELGKTIGIDLEEGKVTLPLIDTLKKAEPAERERIREIITADYVSRQDFGFVHTLIKKYKSLEYTSARADSYLRKAHAILNEMPQTRETEALHFITDYVLHRDR